MLKFFKFVLGSLIGGVVGAFLGVFLLIALSVGLSQVLSGDSFETEASAELPKDSILVLNLAYPVSELAQASVFSSDSNYNIHDLRDNLEKASEDKKISALFIRMSSSTPMGWSTAKELKTLVSDFAESGKSIVAYGERVDEKSLYIASSAKKIYMHPTGEVLWNGFAATPSFYTGFFKKLSLKPIIFRAGKFKSAIERFVNTKMSPESKQQTRELLEDLWEETVEGVAASRNLSGDELKAFADAFSVRTADQAKKVGMIDGVARYTSVLEKLLGKTEERELTSKDLKRFYSLQAYASSKKSGFFGSLDQSVFSKKERSENKIGVLVLEGNIMPGRSAEGVIGSGSVVLELQKLRFDEDVKGVILRINSPGGSALASDVIWHEVEKLKEVKPVYVSMGDVAASGGYYIAAGANKIFAEENTITGSIGVFSVLFNAKETMNNKVGFTFDRVVTSDYADLGSSVRDMTAGGREIFQNSVERIYKTFLQVVGQGRSYTSATDVEIVAQGRVWSGNQAKEVGLVDEIGGLEDAGLALAEELKLETYDLDFYPKVNAFDRVFAGIEKWSSYAQKAEAYLKAPELNFQKRLQLLSSEGPLLVAPHLEVN